MIYDKWLGHQLNYVNYSLKQFFELFYTHEYRPEISFSSVRTEQFLKVLPFIHYLFPLEDLNSYYRTAYRNDENVSVSASGKFYNFYRKCRNLFFRADLINEDKEDKTPSNLCLVCSHNFVLKNIL